MSATTFVIQAWVSHQTAVKLSTTTRRDRFSTRNPPRAREYVDTETLAFAIHHILQGDTEELIKHLSAHMKKGE